MSSSVKDLLDYNLVKNCNKCGIVQIITNFYFRKDRNKCINQCKKCVCARQKATANIDNEKKKEYMKVYRTNNRERLDENN